MASLNAGVPGRFENGGVILIGTDDVLQVVEGTLKWKLRGHESIPQTDRGALTVVVAGNERPCEVEFDIKYTSVFDADAILAKIMGPLVAGKVSNRTNTGEIFTFDLTVRLFAAAGQAFPYDQAVFTKCYLADGIDFSAAAGQDVDKLSLKLMSHSNSPTFSRPTS